MCGDAIKDFLTKALDGRGSLFHTSAIYLIVVFFKRSSSLTTPPLEELISILLSNLDSVSLLIKFLVGYLPFSV